MSSTQHKMNNEKRLYNGYLFCLHNAYLNQQGIYKNLDLKIVIGSIAFNGWWEFGGKGWTMMDFINSKRGKTSWDAHAWLEDDEGNVYDWIFEEDSLIAILHTGKPLKCQGRVERRSKADLEARGVSYEAADEQTQYVIRKSWLKTITENTAIDALQQDDYVIVQTGFDVKLAQIKDDLPIKVEAGPCITKYVLKDRQTSIYRPYILVE